MPLTDKQIRNATKAAKPYRKSDCGGLYVMVMPTGAKRWHLTYRWLGTQRTLALGVYPAITLTAARQARATAQAELANGVDPSAAHRTRAAQIAAETTFETVAREWHEIQKSAWSADYADTVMRRLATDVFPVLGHRRIIGIEPTEVLDMLRSVERRDASDTAFRLKQHISTIFRFAITIGRARRDPAADLKIGLRTRSADRRHNVGAPRFDLPSFLRTLGDDDGDQLTRLALGLFVLTLWTRTICVRAGGTRSKAWMGESRFGGFPPTA